MYRIVRQFILAPVLLLAGCSSFMEASRGYASTVGSRDPVAGLWVAHAEGGRFNDHVLLLRISDPSGPWGERSLVSLPTRDWRDSTLNDLAANAAVLAERDTAFGAGLDLVDGARAELLFEPEGDVLSGTLTLTDSLGATTSHVLYGVRAGSALKLPSEAAPTLLADTITSSVVLRLDDGAQSDRDLLQRIWIRGLVAEIALPTSLLDTPGRLTWSEAKTWAARGFSIVAHSRTHSTATDSSVGFISEVVGSLSDLADHGLPTLDFVQPGNWRAPLYFSSASTLRNWRGSLFRTMTRALEAEFAPATIPVPITRARAYGLPRMTVTNGVSSARILNDWRVALGPRRLTVFLFHSATMPRTDTLDWFLDSVASAKAQGRVRVVASVLDLVRP